MISLAPLNAQIPDPARVVDAAAAEGWMAALLAFIFICVIGFLVWLVKAWIDTSSKREERMAKRIDELESFIQREMMALLMETKKAFVGLFEILKSRPCLVEVEERIANLEAKK